jgi:hypothetical protein
MNGLQVKYAELLNLSVKQSFYQNGVCRKYLVEPALDMMFVPTDETRNVMNRMDLIFRNTDTTGGFTVWARIEGKNATGHDLLRFQPKKGDKLSFLIILKNPDVLNFNELPVQLGSEQIYYFSNDRTDQGVSRSSLHISKGVAGVDGAVDRIKKSSGNYRYHHSAVVAQGAAKVKHVLTGSEIAPVSLVNLAGQTDLTFNLLPLPSGKCQLSINNALTEEFYYPGNVSPQPIFGVIELSLSPTLSTNYRVIEPDKSLTPQRPNYHIHFTNRKTLWRYTIHLQPYSPLFLEIMGLDLQGKTEFFEQLNIVCNDSAFKFTLNSATDTDIVFVSTTLKNLEEKYVLSFGTPPDALTLTLKKYEGDIREAAVKENLPYPSTGSVNVASDGVTIYSDVFLTL